MQPGRAAKSLKARPIFGPSGDVSASFRSSKAPEGSVLLFLGYKACPKSR